MASQCSILEDKYFNLKPISVANAEASNLKEKDKEADHNCTVAAIEGALFGISEGIGGAIVGAAVGAVSSPCRDASKRVSAIYTPRHVMS